MVKKQNHLIEPKIKTPIVRDLSNEKRIQVLYQLSGGQSNLSLIAESMNLSTQATLLHLGKLVNSGLIKREGNGRYSISACGKLVLYKIPSFGFISQNRDYLTDHFLGEAPSTLAKEIGLLSQSHHVDGIVSIFERWQKIVSDSNLFFYSIMSDSPHRLATPLREKMRQGLEVKLIFNNNGYLHDYSEFVNKFQLESTARHINFECRNSDSTLVNLIITEQDACVLFPKINGFTDFGRMFIGSDKNFRQWCMDFFQTRWRDAIVFGRYRKNLAF